MLRVARLRTTLVATGLAASLCAAGETAALAQTEGHVPQAWVVGTGDCPSAPVVESEALRLIPEAHRDVLVGVKVEIEDLGGMHLVRVTRERDVVERSYTDELRECDQRARFSAIFVVLTLMPPDLPWGPAAPPALPEAPPQPAPPATRPAAPPKAANEPERRGDEKRASPLSAELGTVLEWSPPLGQSLSVLSTGAVLRAVLGRGIWSGTLSVAYLPTSRFEIGGSRGRLTRLPATLGSRVKHAIGALELAGDLEGLAAFERVEGDTASFPEEGLALELGLRAGALASAPVSWPIRPVIGAAVSVVPAPRRLVALPRGVVGNMPYLWFGATLGLNLSP